MKLRPTMVMVLAVSAASLAVTAAYAQPDDKHWVQRDKFRSLDRNGDGFLTKNEASSIRDYGEAFGKADVDRDGKLSVEEFLEAEAMHDRKQAGRYVSDATVTAKVKTALFREPDLKAMAVNVETSEGRVQLSGWVDSEAQRAKAMQVAKRVDGVKEVRDAMSVK